MLTVELIKEIAIIAVTLAVAQFNIYCAESDGKIQAINGITLKPWAIELWMPLQSLIISILLMGLVIAILLV